MQELLSLKDLLSLMQELLAPTRGLHSATKKLVISLQDLLSPTQQIKPLRKICSSFVGLNKLPRGIVISKVGPSIPTQHLVISCVGLTMTYLRVTFSYKMTYHFQRTTATFQIEHSISYVGAHYLLRRTYYILE